MDDKELRLDSGLSTSIHDDCTKRIQNGNMPHKNREKSFSDSPHPSGKADTRPCAIIGPDRVLPPTDSSDVYMKTIPVDPWEYSDNYRYPYDSIKMADYHQTRNISPRQTFQENMQRIMVPPTYSSIKNSEEASLKNAKLNLPSDGKYCDVPYSINTINSEHKNVRSDSVMPTINPSFSRGVPSHGWHAGPGVQPLKPYQTPEYYQNSEYANCTGLRPMPVQPQRIVHEELLPVYQDRLYQDSNIRFKPYPSGKERFPQARYEYVSNNTFQPPSQIPLHKYDVQKPMHNHHYSMYPQGPYKYIDRRYPEPMIEGYPRGPHPQHNTFRTQQIHPHSYTPLPGNFYQNKPYPCPSETAKPMHLNKISYDANNKIYLELENSRSKGYPLPDNYFYNERAKFMRGEVLVPGHGHASMNSVPQQHLYRKDNSLNTIYDHSSHYRHRDHHVNVTNPISRLPMQLSPNTIAISPCNSITSNETQMLGMQQEDCGYASQSSTTSVKSMDSNNGPVDYYKRQVYNYASTQNNFQRGNISSKPANTSDKKGLNVRQFLQMWNEGDEEEPENNKEIQNNSNNNVPSRSHPNNNNQEQLYVLGLVNVSSEDLSKYEHLQKVSKLPENIKGYNNIEILNQFEQLVESPSLNNFHAKKPPLKEYKVVSQSFTNKQTKEDLLRPISPLDVEAKISQSVIHKEVGCNFEIKPCSPKVLNVDMATPVHDVLGERLIEKVTNPVLLNIGRGKEIRKDKSVEIDGKSCKMINSNYSPNNSTAIKSIYPLQELDTNIGVCLASLPQLDNDIELNLPEVNQQFIDANKIGASPLTHSNLPGLEINEQDNSATKNKNDFQSNCDEQGVSHTETDKEIVKLSKYRKTKKLESSVIDNNMPTLTQRTDSVIIKNPENVKIQNESYNSYGFENCTVNKNIQSDVINKHEISNNLQSCENVETAIDFSFTRNESISHSQVSANNECNISTSFLLQEPDFCKNNIALSLPSLPTENIVEDNVIINSDENQRPVNSYSESPKENSQVTEPNPKEEEVKTYLDIENVDEKSIKSKNKMKYNVFKELKSDEPFNEYESQISISECDENTKLKKENIYHKDNEIPIQCNHENNLPDLTSESVDPESSDSNIYSHFKDYSNNKIDENKICVQNLHPNVEKNDIDNTTNISNVSTNSTVSISCYVTTSNCTISRENLINDLVLLTDKIPKENENITEIKSNDGISEKTVGTGCCVNDKELLLSHESLCVDSTQENNDDFIYDFGNKSKNNSLKSDDSIRTVLRESNIVSMDVDTDDVSSEEKSFIPNSLIIKQEVAPNNNLIFENTIETTDSKTKNVIVSSTVLTDMMCNKEKEEVDFPEDNSISENSSDKDFKTNSEMLFSNILDDDESVFVRDNEYSHKTLCKNDVENSNLISDNIIKPLSYEDKCKTLSLDVATHTTNIEDIDDNYNQEANIIKNNNVKDQDLCNFTQTTNCQDKEILSANAPSKDEFDCKLMSASKDSIEIQDLKFNNSFETKVCEFKNELSNNCIDDTSINQNDSLINFQFTNKVEHSPVKNLDISNSAFNKIRVHRKALFSPWIQKLILYNGSCNENEHNTLETYGINIDFTESESYTNYAKKGRDLKTLQKLDGFSSLTNNESDQVNNLQSYSLKEFNDEDGIAYEYKNNCESYKTLPENECEIESTCLESFESERNKILKCSSPCMSTTHNTKLLSRTNKRSLSDTAIERYFDDNTEHLFISKKYKKYDDEVSQSQLIETNLCNIIQTHRRNSISEIYNDGNVFILIDKDLILTEENEEQKICFTDVESVTDNIEYNSGNVDDINTLTEYVPQDGKELWMDDVARIETIFSDEVAEDVEISTPISPKGPISNDYETLNNESFILCEEVIRNMENDVDIYEGVLCKEDAHSVDSLCEIPKTFTYIESQHGNETFTEDKIELKLIKEDNILNFLNTNDTLFPKNILDTCSDNNNRILDDKENLEIDNILIQDSTKSQNSVINETYDDFNCAVYPCNYSKYSSSPEVTSTTCEDKNAGILLKISNLKGSRTSQLDNETSNIKSKISYKLTEKKTYKHYNPNFNSSGTLITKAAQKYIPPLKITMSDLKVKLPLPQNSLDKLKKLKKSKAEPKIDKKPLKPNSKSSPREYKKQKPKFEDVLLSIDEIHYNKHKVKNKKVSSEIPKVVIKKNETGAHYTSCRSNDQDRHDPDLTGRKWQPWVFLEKNSFIDKMVLKHKLKAIYCRRKNTFVLADKFRKYKSVYNAKFVISQPKTDDLSKGNLKYTIRLKHN